MLRNGSAEAVLKIKERNFSSNWIGLNETSGAIYIKIWFCFL
jgi:hypothetical protein